MALLSLNLLIALTIALPLTTQATSRYDELLCEEVTEAVNESVLWGTLTQAEADDISDRCFELYYT